MPDVLITENIIGSAIDLLQQRFECVFEPELWTQRDRLHAMMPQFRALIVRNQTQVTKELLVAARQLEVVGRAGVGMDNIDLEAASERGVVVAFTPDQNSNSVAELAIGLIISLARMIPAADRNTKLGNWGRQRFTGFEIVGRTLGIIGLGRIGGSLAAKARALGMDIIANDPFIDPEGIRIMEVRARMVGLDELLREADFVSCHVPQTSATINLLDYDRIRLMKPSAYLVNTSRGGVVSEAGLIRALQEKAIAGAALDVRQQEPPSASPLVEMDQVILTPHIAAFTHEGQRRVVNAVCRDVSAVLSGEAATNFANFNRPKARER